MADIYIRGGWIITVDKNRRVIRDGAIAVEGSRIVAVGKREKLDREYKEYSDIVIDASRKIVMPGFIDLHVHMAQAMIRGMAQYVKLIPWLKDYVWPLQGNYTKEDGKTSALLCMVEMLKSGTTTFLEAGLSGRYGMEGIAEALEQIGMRGILGRHVMDMPGYALEKSIIHPGLIETKENGMKEVLHMYQKWHGKHGRIFVWFAPRTPGAVTIETYREIVAKAKELKIGITMHLAEAKEDLEYFKKEFKMKPVEFCNYIGMLGSNVVLIHVVWVTDEEIKLLAKTGTHVAHNPSCNMKLGSGLTPVAKMLREGVNVGLGCDGGPSNDNYDMVEEMKIAALGQALVNGDPKAITAEQVIEMATINGAKAIGLSKEIGSIEVGKKADIILIDYWKPHLIPMLNPVTHIVYAAQGQDIDTVIVDGKIIMKNRKILTVNEEKILEEAEKRGHEVIERTGIEPIIHWPII
ncbi:MAG: amidohydrolase [Thermoprotei archaeon]|nr:MAG: amidohydrolase [Thermoprotei archaeon]